MKNYLYNFINIFYTNLSIVKRIMNGVAVPAVVTSAVPTTEEIAITKDVETTSIARP